jgi:hypothetical protein
LKPAADKKMEKQKREIAKEVSRTPMNADEAG